MGYRQLLTSLHRNHLVWRLIQLQFLFGVRFLHLDLLFIDFYQLILQNYHCLYFYYFSYSFSCSFFLQGSLLSSLKLYLNQHLSPFHQQTQVLLPYLLLMQLLHHPFFTSLHENHLHRRLIQLQFILQVQFYHLELFFIMSFHL